MARCSTTHAHNVVALRIEIEERIKCGGAEHPRRGYAGLLRDITQRFQREELVRVALLHCFENAEQGSWLVFKFHDGLIDEKLLVRFENCGDTLSGGGWHKSPPT